jgi:hypothetical protein
MGIKKVLHIATLLLSLTLSAQSVVEHTVVKGNTLYSLSKQYGVSIESIQDANPDLQGTALSLGQVLVIPSAEASVESAQEENAPPPPPVSSDEYEMYKVKKGDTPASLAQAWGYKTMRAFYRLNPDARTSWKKGMILIKPIGIPVEPTDSVALAAPVDSLPMALDSSKHAIEVVGLLPFFHRDYINETPLSKRTAVAMSFRQGMELAAAHSSDSTFQVNLSFLDTYNQKDSMAAALGTLNADSVDLIIGPLYSKRVLEMASFVAPSKVVSPLSKNEAINTLPIQNAVVAEHFQWQAIVNVIDERTEQSKALAADTKGLKPHRTLIIAQSNAKTESALSGKFSVFVDPLVIKATEKWKENERLAFLDSSVHYDLIIYDNDPAFVLDVLRNLRAGRAKFSWYTIENQIVGSGITADNFAREREVICAFSAYLDYQSVDVLTFIQAFRERFGHEPDEYAFKGYDIMNFHVQNLRYGTQSMRGTVLGFERKDALHNGYTELRTFKDLSWKRIGQ